MKPLYTNLGGQLRVCDGCHVGVRAGIASAAETFALVLYNNVHFANSCCSPMSPTYSVPLWNRGTSFHTFVNYCRSPERSHFCMYPSQAMDLDQHKASHESVYVTDNSRRMRNKELDLKIDN